MSFHPFLTAQFPHSKTLPRDPRDRNRPAAYRQTHEVTNIWKLHHKEVASDAGAAYKLTNHKTNVSKLRMECNYYKGMPSNM